MIVALTIDWEGAYFSPEGLDAIDELRAQVDAPITHYVSAAYFTKPQIDSTAVVSLRMAIRSDDELAVHLHGWKSLAAASHVEPRLSPSFLSGTNQLLELDDDDAGFDTDLDTYSVPELRAMVRTSRQLLAQHLRLPVSRTFRAGGYLGTPKVLQAIHDEGFTIDSSATDHRQLDEQRDAVLPARIRELWPDIETMSQPFVLDVTAGTLLEMPITAIADYVTAAELVAVFDRAAAQLRDKPDEDVFVVLGFHQETAHEFVGRLVVALGAARVRGDIASSLVFMTLEKAAEEARAQLAEQRLPARP